MTKPGSDLDALRLQSAPSLPRLVWEKVPFLLLAFAAGVRALIAQEQGGALQSLAVHGIWDRLAQTCHGLVFYIGKTLWPTRLGPLYEIPPSEVLFGLSLWISIFIIVVVGTLAVLLRRRAPAVGAALAVYVVVLLPVLGLAQSGPQFVADRYSYLSCIGFAVLAGAGWLKLRGRLAGPSHANLRAVLVLGTAGIVLALANATRLQAEIWITGTTLWNRGLQISPNSSIVHTNYADALVSEERFKEAEFHYRQALTLNARDAVALHHLGDLRRLRGDDSAAITCYLEALKIDPNRQRACFALALLLIKRGHDADAVTILRDGAQRRPQALKMIDYLAALLAAHPNDAVRDPEEAIRWAEHVNRAQRYSYPPAMMTLATAYASAGRFDDAVQIGEQAMSRAADTASEGLIVELEHRLALFRQGKPYRFQETP